MQKYSDKSILFSAMRPTGDLHLGHFLGVLKDWVSYQDRYECYFMIADWHAFMSEYKDPLLVKNSILSNLAIWLAIGINPSKSVVFLQSDVREHLDLYTILSLITPLSWLERCPTYKEQLKELTSKEIKTHAFLGYPLLQTVDIILYGAKYVPVGIDQLPHLELGREIIRRFHHLFNTKIFTEPRQLVKEKFGRFLGIDGRKMSKSYDNHISLNASKEELEKRVQKMKTDPSRVRLTDKGNPSQCLVFDYHKIFNSQRQSEIKDWCVFAKKGCRDCKGVLFNSLNQELKDIRLRYDDFMKDKEKLRKILSQGAEKAKIKSQQTMKKVRCALKMMHV